jgi:hypothetical protein
MRAATLGVDFGRVINDASSHPSGDDTSFLQGSDDEMLATPAMAGVMESLGRLVTAFACRVWIVSKAGPRIEDNTRRWLEHHNFYERTGLPSTNLRFVRRRVDKRDQCAALGITHFVDDRIEVIEALSGTVAHLYLFGPQDRPAPAEVIAVPDWEVTEAAILTDLQSPHQAPGTRRRSPG